MASIICAGLEFGGGRPPAGKGGNGSPGFSGRPNAFGSIGPLAITRKPCEAISAR
jgi:hypothetical protein